MAITSCLATFRKDINGIIYDLPLGKLVIEDGKEKRVKIEPFQGACFYAAMSRLFHTTSSAKQDQFYSQHLPTLLQRITKLDTFVSKRLFYPDDQNFYQEVDQQFASEILKMYKDPESKISKVVLPLLGEDRKQVERNFPAEELEGFIQSSFGSFHDYSCDKFFTEKRNAYLEFYKNCIPGVFDEMQSIAFNQSPRNAMKIIQACTQTVIAQDYGFKSSTWEPVQTIDNLLEELNNHGPLIVTGNFGRSYYENPPEKSKQQYKKVTIYFWNNTTNKRLDIHRTHAVIVIGAIKQDKFQNGGAVYFIDPNDPSDPAENKYNLYMISYKNLQTYANKFELMDGYAIY